MERVPRIVSVGVVGGMVLLVRFEDGTEKTYDCTAIISRPQFHLLRDPAFLKAVRVDAGGYGVSWNDDIDISEYELWTNGEALTERRGG